MRSVPEDRQLPSGWVCRQVTEDELVLGHRMGGVEVVATRTDETDRLPFEAACGWDLACRVRAGESVSERTIGRATTRQGALSALHPCMEHVNTLVRSAGSTEDLCLTSIVREIEQDEGSSAIAHDTAARG